MTEQVSDSGLEVVLDNRKLIIAFLVLIAVCGCFYVIGFIEGKRQGYQEGMQLSAESASKTTPDRVQTAMTMSPNMESSAKPAQEGIEEKHLDWYKSVNRREEETPHTPGLVAPVPSEKPALKAAEAAARAKTPAAPASAGSSTYTVQVGAFRQRSEAEIKARMLRAKGFDCRIESPEAPGQLYLIKVGRFKSRAEAVAMQLRLKKGGFDSFIKTN